jgi:hypothetical protein
MNIRARLPLGVLSLLLVFGLLPRVVPAAEALQPSYQCLPEETVFVIRVPEGLKFVDAFRSQTKLGSVLLSPKRFEGIVNLIREQAAEGLTQFSESLAKYNLKIEDFPKLFDKEVGFALVLEPRHGKYPLVVGLTWAEPDSDLGQRLLAALAQAVDENKGEPGAVRRLDLDVDGQQVMQLTLPERGPATSPSLDVDELRDLDNDQIQAKLEEQRRKAAEGKQVEVDQTHIFLARVGDRLLMANTFGQSESEVRELLGDDPDKAIDLTSITGAEEAKGVFVRFLKAHSAPPSGLTPRIMSTPGLAAALPDGVTGLEVLFSIDPLLKLAADADNQATSRVLKTLGLDRVGPGAFRLALDRGAMRMGLFVAAPSPRQGLLTLLDQPTFLGDPPAWVPSNVLGFGQLSFDLGKAYTLLREVLVSEGGDQVQTVLDQVEQQIRSVTQNDVATLLSSVGQNHYFLSFPSTIEKVAAGKDVEISAPSSRQGIVWQLKDEAPWKRLIQMGAGFAALTDGAVTAAEEQGFTGLRLNVEDTFTGGIFVGHGFMVLGIGPDVLEPLMSALRNPPEGAAALRQGDLVSRAATLLPAEQCIYFHVTDFEKYLKTMRQTISSLFDLSNSLGNVPQTLGGPGGAIEVAPGAKADDSKVAEKMKELLPTDEELEGTAGVSVGRLIINDHGLTYRGAMELPPQ